MLPSSLSQSGDDASPSSGKRFRLHWLVLLPLLALGAASFFRQREAGGTTFFLIVCVALTLLSAALLALFSSYLLWRFESVSRRGANIVFSGVLLLSALLLVWSWATIRQNRRQSNVTQFVDSVMHELEARRDAMDAAEKSFTNDGGVTLPRLNSPQALNHRIRLIDAAISANQDYLQFGSTVPAQLDTDLKPLGISQADLRQLNAKFEEDYRWDFTSHVRQAEIKILVAERAVLGFLHEHWGEWTYDKKTNAVHFQSADLQQRVDALENARHQAVADRDNFIGETGMKRAAPIPPRAIPQ